MDQDADLNIDSQFAHPSDSGRSFFGGSTPFSGDRYAGPSLYFPPAPSYATGQIARAPAASAFGSYDEAVQARGDILSDARNLYTTSGRFGAIGTPAFDAEVQQAYVSAGLASAPESLSFGQRYRQNLASGAGEFALGYAGMQVLTQAGRNTAALDNGQYYTPEQQAQQNASIAPGIGGLIGTGVGAFFGPAGAMIGGGIGSGLGSVAEGAVSAGAQRGQDTRETAQMLNTSAGGAAEGVKSLIEALNGLKAPIGVVKESINSIVTGVGPVGTPSAASLSGLGATVNALGEYAGQDYASAARQLRDPALFPVQQRLTQNLTLGVGDNASLGASAILANDPASLIDRQRDIQSATLNGNPDYVAAQGAATKTPEWYEWMFAPGAALVHGTEAWLGGRRARGIQQNTPANPAIAALDRYSVDYRASEYDTVLDPVATGLLAGGVDAVGLRGGSLSELGAATGAYTAGLSRAASDEGMRGDVMRRMLDDPLFKGDRTAIQRELNQSDATVQGYNNSSLQAGRNLFGVSFGTEQEQFSAGQTMATIGGASAASLLAGTRQQAGYLTAVANDPNSPIDPAQRLQLTQQAAVMGYQGQMAVYGQTLDQNAANTAAAGVGVARAAAYGGPSDVAGAQTQVLSEYQARIRELNDILSSGTLTLNDRIAKERELSEARGGAISLQSSIGRDESLGYFGLASTARETAGVGLDRLIAQGGNAALPAAALLAADQGVLTRAQGIVANNPQDRANRALTIRQAQLGIAQDTTFTQTYHLSAAQEAGLSTAQTDFQIAQISPFVNGSNPIQATEGLLGSLRGALSDAQRRDRTVTDPSGVAQASNREFENRLRLEISQVESERLTFGLGLLPETVAGLPGRGYGAIATPNAAVSAFFSPNSRVSGSFGPGGSTPSPVIGGAAGGFGAASGADEAVSLQRETNQLLRQILASGNRGGAPVSSAGAVLSALGTSYHPAQRR